MQKIKKLAKNLLTNQSRYAIIKTERGRENKETLNRKRE
jgi:hypothetical protein